MRSVKKYLADDDAARSSRCGCPDEEGSFERPFCRLGWTTPAAIRPHGAFQLEMPPHAVAGVVAAGRRSQRSSRVLTRRAGGVALVLAFAMGQHTAELRP
jgi:hypothetical protein